MRKMISMITVLMAIITLTSCEPKVSQTVTFQSEDERLKIQVYGERYTSVDPWMMTIDQVIDGEVANSGSVEAFFDAPTTENVTIEWITAQKAVVKFVGKDGVVIPVPVEVQ